MLVTKESSLLSLLLKLVSYFASFVSSCLFFLSPFLPYLASLFLFLCPPSENEAFTPHFRPPPDNVTFLLQILNTCCQTALSPRDMYSLLQGSFACELAEVSIQPLSPQHWPWDWFSSSSHPSPLSLPHFSTFYAITPTSLWAGTSSLCQSLDHFSFFCVCLLYACVPLWDYSCHLHLVETPLWLAAHGPAFCSLTDIRSVYMYACIWDMFVHIHI